MQWGSRTPAKEAVIGVLETKRPLDLDEGRRSRASNVGGRRRLNMTRLLL